MQRLKRFIHEIHHRSLWQVLGIYVVGGWLILQVVDTLAGALNLPEWAPPLALFLLIIGLPIVLATAFVQEGVGRREAPGPGAGEVERTAGGTPIPSLFSRPDGAHHRLFTWRNALISGVIAFAAWGVVASVWIVLGSGIGVGTASAADRRSIAVLPFNSVHTDEESLAFTSGIHDDLLTQLSKIDSLKVISRTSVLKYKDTPKSVREIGQELGVATVLEGGVQRSGDRVRLNVQLIDARNDEHLWAETYDERLTAARVFAIQSDLATKIAGALNATLSPEVAARIEAQPTEDLEAFNLYQRGRFVWNQRTREGLLQAVDYFRQAIARDSTYAAAWAGLSDAYLILDSYGYMPRDEALPAAEQAAQTAIRLDETLGEAHTSLAGVYLNLGRTEDAEREFRRAIELNPGYATAHHWYGILLRGPLGRDREGLAEARLAYELDPLSPVISQSLANALIDIDDWEGAIEVNYRILEFSPEFEGAHEQLVNSLVYLGRTDEAVEAAQRAVDRNPGSPRMTAVLSRALSQARDFEGALSWMDSTVALAPDDWPVRAEYADLLGDLGRTGEAVAQARRGVELNPQAPGPHQVLAWALFEGGDSDGAVEEMEAAVRIAPDDPGAHSTFAWLLLNVGRTEEALRQARRALDLAPRSVLFSRQLGDMLARTAPWSDHGYEAALEQLDRALELVPGDPDSEDLYADVLVTLGRTDEAVSMARALYARDSVSIEASRELAGKLRAARMYDEAIGQFEHTLSRRPTDVGALIGLAVSQAAIGGHEEALETHARLSSITDPQDKPWDDDLVLAALEAMAGNSADSRRILGTLTERENDSQFRSNLPWIAAVYAQLGETDAAFEWLDRAYDARSINLDEVASDPLFDPLRGDPRFRELLSRMGIEAQPTE